MPTAKFPLSKPDKEWAKELSPEEFQMLRRAGTETPKTGEYYSFFPTEGHFACRACKHPLYASSSKFKDCGWDAFVSAHEIEVVSVRLVPLCHLPTGLLNGFTRT